ncbi:GntR family transcriptional regulator [Pararhodobacter sp. SW119]|uniref:GntR family transcriptional regulator n=1 Tax=Pararhodobacter sp. SW119 TaxID=2780075 RepID=UPI001ADEE163|nr:GntR family transcriptional regulator [Pararhodobacter sp. SW119]
MASDFEAIDHVNLGEVVYQRIAGALVKGALQPGQRLRIRDLAEQMGTSSTPVRDALIRLVHEGALKMRSLRDIRVPILDSTRYLEIRDIRLELEGLAAERAAKAASPEDVARLESLLAENERVLAEGDIASAVAMNQVFHFQLAEIAAMPTLRGILQNLWLQMGPVIAAAYTGGGRTMIEHHYVALEAIRRKDGKAAKQAIRDDLFGGGAVIIDSKVLSNAPSGDRP